MRLRCWRCLVLGMAVGVMALGGAVSASAFQPLPSGGQVNDDPAAGIDPAQPVSGDEPTNADVVGGALTAGKVAVPWAIFRQQTTGHDQAFVRSFAGGAWTTRGMGTVGGQSSATSVFPGSLNFDQAQDGEAPSIDFAGAGRTVPWATWYEDTAAFGLAGNIFASRFDNTGDANQNKWIFSGQSRGTGTGTVPVPSLNIHTDQDAENPSVAGGSAVDPTKPGPWVTWQETSTATGNPDQIFVSRPLGPGQTNCDGVTPAAVDPSAAPIGGFCFQQTGIPRFGPPSLDPSLNVDPTRDGIEPDIAFTGSNDSVPWVVWYEQNPSGIGLHSNELVFAAKGISDGVTENGGFHWVVVGSQLPQQELDTTGTNKFGGCAESFDAESACALNSDPKNDNAEDPRVAAGTMNPANPTVPWVTWDESVNGVDQIFVSRLVGGSTGTFEIAGGGAISTGPGNATRPDITFSGNTPYVSWRQVVGGVQMGFAGHFVNAANPTFMLDESDVPLVNSTSSDVREPISSGCIADPFNADGTACQGGAAGTPFFLFTNVGLSPRSLFADAYQPETPATAPASNVTTSGGTLNGTVNPVGGAVKVSFDFGPNSAYGQNISAGTVGVSNAATVFSANLTGLAAGSTVHYRAVATTDFGRFVGADQTLTVATPPMATPPVALAPLAPPLPPGTIGSTKISKAKVSGLHVSLLAKCTGSAGQKCKLSFKLTVREKFKGRKLVAISTRKVKTTHKTVVLGTTTLTLSAGKSKTVKVFLNGKGKRLLARHRTLKVRLKGTQPVANKKTKTVINRVFTFKAPKKKKGHK